MGKRPQNAIVGERVSELGEKQGFNDLKMIWSAVKREANGGDPLRPDVREKIIRSLIVTIESKGWTRTRLLAAAILLAISDGDFERDVFRQPTQRSRRHRRTRK